MSYGWKCDGYTTDKADLTSVAVKQDNSAPILAITRYSLPFRIPGSQKDRQLLHYFCVQGSHDLAGFLNFDFWTRTVLEQSHQEPTVRQALVSLSSLHLDCTTASSGAARNETLMQYGKALRMLQKRLRTPGTDATRTALVCSILFHCFEATIGNSQAAMHHLQGGLSMLSSCHQQSLERTEELDVLSLELERLDLQATLFYDQPSAHVVSEKDENSNDAPNVNSFRRLSDAHRTLVKLIYRGFHLISDNIPHKFASREFVPPPVLQQKLELSKSLHQWKAMFDAFKEKLDQEAIKEYGCQILLIHWHLATMLLDAVYPVDRTVFCASPNPRAMHVLELVEGVLARTTQQNPASPTSRPPQRVISSEIGVVAPLFALALKCADDEVCDRALELLNTTQRREGLWEASHMASMIQQLRDARERRLANADEEFLVKARSQSLEQLFWYEFSSPYEGLNMMTTYVEQAILGIYAPPEILSD
ncbi:hypothetical protein N0V90_011377 [Kalmusia sp. IMI 367209]|nr:hypothetical protein N0V90_011377 [Kalmusia sp. IMI 367209]